ncbi:Multiple epidermal growth factor-like domains protein 8 [Mortierella antarctica]|nr:Multiple epidermal growth factor-like domains protein 8 [Mortierella antarctica]
MRLITSAVAAFAVVALTVVRADNPKPTIGHTATLIDKTVFIQGGSSALNTAQNSAFSLILGANGTLKDSTLLDHTTLSQFRARDFHGSVATNGLMINCGSMDGAPTSGAFTCDIFNVVKYNSTTMTNVPSSAVSRGGAASTIADGVAYFIGGSGANDQGFSNKVNVLVLGTMDQLKWRVDTDMKAPTRYHTATYVQNVGVVVLGGQIQGGQALGMNSAMILNAGNWTERPIAGDTPPARFGHSAVLSETDGILYIYGGKANTATAPMNDIYSLETKAATWAWKKLSAPTAEPRAFHASVLLDDGNILHTFGQGGVGPETAVATFSSYNIKSNAWTAAFNPPPATVITESPIKNTGPCSNPNLPECEHPQGDNSNAGAGGAEGSKKANVGLIAGVTVAALIILVVGGFLFRRHRNGESLLPFGSTKRSNKTDIDAGPLKRHHSTGGNGDGEGGKLGRSFTIRKPPSVYVENDQDLDQTHYPRYANAQDASNNPYYGDRQYNNNNYNGGVIEYELSDTSGQKYGPSSVAERKKYVEQQQKEVLDKYEMFDRFDQQNAPNSPYSQATTLASNNSNPRSPTVGSARSPRTEFQQPSYGGRQQQQNQRDGYY